MSYPINQNIKPYSQQQLQQQQLAMGLNTDKEKDSQSFEKVNVSPEQVKTVAVDQTKKSWIGRISDNLAAQDLTIGKAIICALGAVGVVYGASGAMNTFIRKGGMFKMGKAIDDFSFRMLKNKKVASVVDKISKTTSSLKSRFAQTDLGKLLGDKKNLLQPKNQMAAFMSRGTKFEAVDEVTDTMKAIINQGSGTKEYKGVFGELRKSLDDLMEKMPWEQTYKKASKDNYKKFRQIIGELPTVKNGKESVDDVIAILLKSDESADAKFAAYKKVEPALKKYFGYNAKDKAELIDILSKGQKGERFIQKINIMGMTHRVDLGEAVKKVMLLYGETAQTGLGKAAQMASLRSIEGVSNGVTSRSKMGLLMGLGIYWGITKKVVNAPKGERAQTAVDEVVQDMGGYMMMPLTAGVVYSAASLKNWGISPDNIQKFKVGSEQLAKQYALAPDKASKKSIMQAYKALKKEVYSQGKLYQKILRKPAEILSTGLISRPGNFLSNFKNRFGGGALRFWACMFVVAPLLMKPVISLSRALFGKTTAVKKEEAEMQAEKEAKKYGSQLNPIVYPDYTQQNGQTTPIVPVSTMQPLEKNNGLEYSQANNNRNNTSMIPTEEPKKRRYIPSDENVIARAENNLLNMYTKSAISGREMIPVEESNKRRYMPSSDAAPVSMELSAEKKAQLSNADKKAGIAEKWAKKYVKED